MIRGFDVGGIIAVNLVFLGGLESTRQRQFQQLRIADRLTPLKPLECTVPGGSIRHGLEEYQYHFSL